MNNYSAMAAPKASWSKKTKKRKYKRKSILQPKEDRRCFLCMLLNGDYRYHSYLEEHHVLFGCNKRISDEYGLLVNLCPGHHRISKEAVHNNNKNAKLLMRIAQERFMEEYPDLDWMEIVGRNYLEDEDETAEETDTQI